MFCHRCGAVLNDDAGKFCGKCGSPHTPQVQAGVAPSVTPLVAPSFSTTPRSLRQAKLFCVIIAALILGCVYASPYRSVASIFVSGITDFTNFRMWRSA